MHVLTYLFFTLKQEEQIGGARDREEGRRTKMNGAG